MASKCPPKLRLPLVILKDSSMTLEVETKEKELDTGSHTLQRRGTPRGKVRRLKSHYLRRRSGGIG